MGTLGDVLEAIYEAPRLTGALHARAHQVQDATRIREVHDWWTRRHRGGSGSAMLLVGSASDVGDPARHETDHELWRADEAHWRADAGSWVTVLTDDAVLSWSAAGGGVRNPDREQAVSVWDPVLRPRWLLTWFDVTVDDHTSVAGRPCWSVRLTATQEARHLGVGMPRWFGSEVECAIDQESGIVLSYVARFDGAAVDAWTTSAFEMVPAIDAAVFAFTPPDGSRFRDPREAAHESMLRAAREAGVDLSGVDTTDHEAVMRAYMLQKQQRAGFGPPDPAALAEQFVPTGPPPADVAAAEAEVRAVFEQMLTASEDGTAVPAVQGGENLGPALAEAAHRAPGGTQPAAVLIELMKFLGADEAVAWFSLERDGAHLFGPVAGRARRIGGRWLVTRETFAQLVGSVGVQCPPPPSPDVH
jgi:hypothetical protein